MPEGRQEARTIIVEGGPGTGKTVVAVNLLAQLTNEGQFVQYCSKNQAPELSTCRKLKGQVEEVSIDNMFKGSGFYVDAGRNVVDTVLVDEAHRLNEKPGQFHNREAMRTRSARSFMRQMLSVFFIDESQRVTMSDIGSVEEIRLRAGEEGSEVIEMELLSQFRCNGSNGYLAWLDDMLEIRETANYDMERWIMISVI